MLLGDMVAGITKFFGVQPCTPCEQRRRAFNAWHAQITGQALPPDQAPQVFVMEAQNGQLVRHIRLR
jgi:hypothetical protein